MAAYTATISVANDHLTPVTPESNATVTVSCLAGGTVYYADSQIASASQNQGSLAAGQSATFSQSVWLRSASHSDVMLSYADVVLPIPELPSSTVQVKDVTAFGAKVDGRMLSGLAVSGTALTSTTPMFQLSDAGKTICLFLANGSGIAGQSTILAYNSPTSVTLAGSIASPAAPAKVQEVVVNLAGNGSVTTYTASLSGVAAGDSLVLFVIATCASLPPALTVADNVSGVWTNVTGTTVPTGAGPTEVDVWQCVSSPGGSVTVTVTSAQAGVTSDVAMQLMEFSGIGQPDQIGFATGNSTTMLTQSITPTVGGELFYAAGFSSASVPSVYPAGNWTNENGPEWNNAALKEPISYQVQAGTGALSAQWTVTAGVWVAIIISFRATGPVSAGVVGTDDTAAWQSAINWAYSLPPGLGGRVTYNPGAGISLIAGPQVTGMVASANPPGTGTNYSYSGQLLLPAVSLYNGSAMGMMEIQGTTPPAGVLEYGSGTALNYPPSVNGLVLQSTATSGNIIDVVGDPHGFVLGKGVFSWIQFNARRVSFRTVLNDSGQGAGGLNLLGCACASLDETAIDVANHTTINDGPPSTGPQSSSGTGLVLPGNDNWAVVNWQRSQIVGYSKGLTHSEHAVLEGYIGNCGAALAPGSLASLSRAGGSHTTTYKRILMQHCVTYIEPMTGDGAYNRAIDGRIEVEGPFDSLINDPSSIMSGNLDVGNAASHMWVRAISSNLFLNSAGVVGVGRQPTPTGLTPVVDSLTSRATGYNPAGQARPFGVCDGSYHGWGQGSTIPAPAIDANGAYGPYQAMTRTWWNLIPNTPPYTSKHISVKIATSPTTHRIFAGVLFRAVTGANTLCVMVDGTANQRVALYSGAISGTLLTSGSATINVSTSYVLDVYVQSSVKPGAGVTVTAYLAGVFMFAFPLTTAQITSWPSPGFDGIGGYLGAALDDGGTRVSSFSINPATDLPYVASGTATLALGTSGSIANTAITANSVIRLTNVAPTGDLGCLGVVLAAGTGFTINSYQPGTALTVQTLDTSKVYWEIASY